MRLQTQGGVWCRRVLLLALLLAAASLLALPPVVGARGWMAQEIVSVSSNLPFNVGINLPCSGEDPTPIILTVHWATSAPSTLKATWCPSLTEEESEGGVLEWGGSRVELCVPHLCGVPEYVGASRGPALLASVSSHRPKVRYTIYFEFTANGAYVESGHIVLNSEYYPAKRIWQGEDAFFNYCIDKDHEITSINHRLGCYAPPEQFVTAKTVWAHPG